MHEKIGSAICQSVSGAVDDLDILVRCVVDDDLTCADAEHNVAFGHGFELDNRINAAFVIGDNNFTVAASKGIGACAAAD